MDAAPTFAMTATRRRADLLDRLSGRLHKVGLDGVLRDLDRAAEPCPVPGEAAGVGFTWDHLDRNDPTWWPQGAAPLASGAQLLVSWYAKRDRLLRTPGSRISVVDRTRPDAPRYRHVLLAAPLRTAGSVTLRTVPVHAGGIAVHDDFLLLADTLFGVRVFRLGDVMAFPRRPTGAHGTAAPRSADRLLRFAGGSDAFEWDYVLPQCMAFRVPLRSLLRRARYSFLSTGQVGGRTNLVVGEYRRRGDRQRPRLARYAIDPATGLPATDAHGRCTPLEVYEDQPSRMQGVAVHESTWVATASNGEGSAGDLYVGTPGAWRRHRQVLPSGPEDLGWSLPGEELWCVSEWPGRRWVFPIATRRW